MKPGTDVRRHRNSGARGFTLPELITVVAIVGVIAALAAPSFNNLIRSQRIKTATNNLVSALIFARSEAVKRNADVTVARVGTNWSGGWTVSYTAGGTQTPRSQPALNQLKVTTTAASLTFGGGGRADALANFTIESDPSISNVEARCVEVGLDGLPKQWVERGGDHDCTDD
jgi:type IV fimbrial biogenesis protein FimT